MRATTFTLLSSLLMVTAGQAPRDFSGTWRLDLSRSDSAAHTETNFPTTIEIKQSAKEVFISTKTTRGATDTTYPIVTGEAPPLGSGPNARWNGDALVTYAVRDINGQSVAVQQTRRLSVDGNEMTVESVVNVQHGYSAKDAQTYGASTDVFVRVR